MFDYLLLLEDEPGSSEFHFDRSVVILLVN